MPERPLVEPTPKGTGPLADALVIVAPDMQGGGSVGTVAWRHAVELSRRHKVHVITRAVPVNATNDIDPITVTPRQWNWLHRYCHVPNEMSFLRTARKALENLCGRGGIDLVWCHSHAIATLVAAPLKARHGFKVVMTTHGDIFDRPPGTYSRELTRFYEWVTPRAYQNSDAVQALSPHMADWAIRGGARPGAVRVIPNGIDPSEIGAGTLVHRPPDSFVPEGTLRLLYVGSLWNLKGVDILLQATARLQTACAATSGGARGRIFRSVSLVLIGEGNLRLQLEALSESLGLGNRVRFLGNVPRRTLAEYYRQADVLCVPSISEALSIVTLEGMLCGLPVVGSRTGGIPFLVEHGSNGYLAEPGDEQSLATAIAEAASSRAHLAELGERGQGKARLDFAWPEIADRLSALARDTRMRREGSD